MKLVVWQDNEKKFEYKYNSKEELFEAIKKFLNDNPICGKRTAEDIFNDLSCANSVEYYQVDWEKVKKLNEENPNQKLACPKKEIKFYLCEE